MQTFRIFLLLLFHLTVAVAPAATWHVDPVRGDDAAVGDAPAPFRTLGRAAKIVNPGDTVLAHPGVYFEHVKLERGGTAQEPVTFRSTNGRDTTIITGANQDLREKRLTWEPLEGTPGLYRVPLKEEPATLLCDELNLYRYPSLEELRTFTVTNVALQNKPGPGPKHGYAWANGFLHVRLHPDGKDGDPNPNTPIFKASPARGTGFRGDGMDARQRANFLLAMDGPAYVVIEGFTFESPGFCGVWVRHGQAVVRDCKFLGCRTGVRGWDHPEKKPRTLSDDVVVERCEFTEHPLYADAAEIIEEVTKLPDLQRAALARFFWWHRKAGAHTSEIGLAAAVGRRWQIRDNFIHDTLDGLSYMSLSWSEDTVVSGNRFERIVDNAVEAENHAQRLCVRDNIIVDCFEPFSYQPLHNKPWPTDIVFERNTVTFTSAGAALWGNEKLGWRPGCVKIYVPQELGEAPGDLVFRKNLIWFPAGMMLSINQAATALRGVRFEGNVVAAQGLGGTEKGLRAQHYQFVGNHTVALLAAGNESMRELAAVGGAWHASHSAAGILQVNASTGRIESEPDSPAAKTGGRWQAPTPP